MARICIDDPLMTPADLRKKFAEQLAKLEGGPFKVTFPELPTFPQPFLPKYSSFRQEVDKFVQEMMTQWQLIIPKYLLELIESLFPVPWPVVPCVNIPLNEMFAKGGVSKAIETVSAQGGIAVCLGLPSPLFPNLTWTEFDVINHIQIAMANVLATLINIVMEKVSQILDYLEELELPGIPAFPVFPSLNSLLMPLWLAVKAEVPEFEIPSLPEFPKLPTFTELIQPLLPHIAEVERVFKKLSGGIEGIPDISGYFTFQYMRDVLSNVFVALIEPIIAFFEDALALLGISIQWPEFCIDVDVSSVSPSDLANEIGGSSYG